MPTLSRPTLVALIASLLLAGCAQHESARSTRPAATTTSTHQHDTPGTCRGHAHAQRDHSRRGHPGQPAG